MTVWDWFKSNAQKHAEAQAHLSVSARQRIIDARTRRDNYQMEQVANDLTQADLAFRRTPDEARAYQAALDLIRERGPIEAARVASLVPYFVAMLSREPR